MKVRYLCVVAVVTSPAFGQLDQPFPPVIELSNLQTICGSSGFVINGIDLEDATGYSVSSARDLNGDGIDDIIIGAFEADPDGNSSAGESYVVFGRDSTIGEDFGTVLELASLDGTNGFVLSGISNGDLSGYTVSQAGDINNDGIYDLLIGAPGSDTNGMSSVGESYVVFGRDTASVGPFGAVLHLSDLDGDNGFVIYGINDSDRSGLSVSAAGDVNNDGVDDILIGAPFANANGIEESGETYVVFGRDTSVGPGFGPSFNLSTLNGLNGFVVRGVGFIERSGFSVSSAGDVNGDGVTDIMIGSTFDPQDMNTKPGRVYLVYGKDTSTSGNFPSTINLSTLNGSNGFLINAKSVNDGMGRAVSSLGDINGDEIDDIMIGAPYASPAGVEEPGECYVIFGRDTSSAGEFTPIFDLSILDGSNGFTIINSIPNGGRSGFSVSSAGDVNNDNIGDILLGAPFADGTGGSAAGESYVLFGRMGHTGNGFDPMIDLSLLDGNNGFAIHGIDLLEQSGNSVSSAGDLNGDGVGDILIGAPATSFPGYTGRCFVVFGRNSNVCSIADVNDDGFVTPTDFTAWIAAFNTMSSGCDQNGDCMCTPTDFTAWINNFNSGCN